VRAREFVTEAQGRFHDWQLGPMTGMKKYPGIDNSNPYHMWRFLVAAAGMPKSDEVDPTLPLSKDGPVGQKLSSLAYTQADADILDATARHLGEKGVEVSSQASTEPVDTNKLSPIKGFKGYGK